MVRADGAGCAHEFLSGSDGASDLGGVVPLAPASGTVGPSRAVGSGESAQRVSLGRQERGVLVPQACGVVRHPPLVTPDTPTGSMDGRVRHESRAAVRVARPDHFALDWLASAAVVSVTASLHTALFRETSRLSGVCSCAAGVSFPGKMRAGVLRGRGGFVGAPRQGRMAVQRTYHNACRRSFPNSVGCSGLPARGTQGDGTQGAYTRGRGSTDVWIVSPVRFAKFVVNSLHLLVHLQLPSTYNDISDCLPFLLESSWRLPRAIR